MRKIINDPDNFVDELIDGILSAHPHMLARLGERAQGHPDPGAVAYLRFLEALQDAVSRTNPLR